MLGGKENEMIFMYIILVVALEHMIYGFSNVECHAHQLSS